MLMEFGRNHVGEFILVAGVLAAILPLLARALTYWGRTPASERTARGYLSAAKSVAWPGTPGALILLVGLVQWGSWLARHGNI
jgi:uncharacterized membrane protein